MMEWNVSGLMGFHILELIISPNGELNSYIVGMFSLVSMSTEKTISL